MARGKSVRLLASIPQHYAPDFMDRLDKRTVLGRAVLERYTGVVSDLGGEDALSNIKHSLIRRFTWYEMMIEGMECRAAAGEGVDIGSWTQLTNSWLGIGRLLGLERRQRPVESLHDLMYQHEPVAPTEAPGDDQHEPDATPAAESESEATTP
jgi:hypothetical protein